ncbi:hypothetical protein [Deinococcus detaillensis]|nr:hypothetical protein [Deinococcus detaillensis]
MHTTACPKASLPFLGLGIHPPSRPPAWGLMLSGPRTFPTL